MAEQVNMSVVKSDELSLIPQTCMVERELASERRPWTATHACAHLHKVTE